MIDGIKFEFFEEELYTNLSFEYIKTLPFFQNTKSLSFKPGINIIFGQNGTGKSTILSMLALSLASKQGGISKVTGSWLTDTYKKGYQVSHDGQPILYCDTKTDVGLIGGQAAFDDDFMSAGVSAITRKASSGLTTLSRLEPVLKVLLHDEPMPTKIEGNQNHIIGSIPEGQKTIIIDEPESGLSYIVQSNLFPKLIDGAKRNNIQLIMASHSPFILGYPEDEIHYIEMEPGFLNNTKNAFLSFSHHLRT